LDRLDSHTKMKEVIKGISAKVEEANTETGIVKGYFSTFGDEDSDGDIVMPGAFLKSIKENGPDGTGRIKHLKDHYQLIGQLLTLKEDKKGLYYESQITKATRGADFLIMCKEGSITEHSFYGYAIKWERNTDHPEKGLVYREIMLREGSTMELWGANPNAKMVAVKSESDALAFLKKALTIGSLSDETLEEFENLYNQITKSKTTQPPKSTVPSAEGEDLINYLKTLNV
jgi:HK97 family phage prohead protease